MGKSIPHLWHWGAYCSDCGKPITLTITAAPARPRPLALRKPCLLCGCRARKLRGQVRRILTRRIREARSGPSLYWEPIHRAFDPSRLDAAPPELPDAPPQGWPGWPGAPSIDDGPPPASPEAPEPEENDPESDEIPTFEEDQ